MRRATKELQSDMGPTMRLTRAGTQRAISIGIGLWLAGRVASSMAPAVGPWILEMIRKWPSLQDAKPLGPAGLPALEFAAGILLILRPNTYSLLDRTPKPDSISLGDRSFWEICVRAIGIALLFGAAENLLTAVSVLLHHKYGTRTRVDLVWPLLVGGWTVLAMSAVSVLRPHWIVSWLRLGGVSGVSENVEDARTWDDPVLLRRTIQLGLLTTICMVVVQLLLVYGDRGRNAGLSVATLAGPLIMVVFVCVLIALQGLLRRMLSEPSEAACPECGLPIPTGLCPECQVAAIEFKDDHHTSGELPADFTNSLASVCGWVLLCAYAPKLLQVVAVGEPRLPISGIVIGQGPPVRTDLVVGSGLFCGVGAVLLAVSLARTRRATVARNPARVRRFVFFLAAVFIAIQGLQTLAYAWVLSRTRLWILAANTGFVTASGETESEIVMRHKHIGFAMLISGLVIAWWGERYGSPDKAWAPHPEREDRGDPVS